jgi:hypothetical protein
VILYRGNLASERWRLCFVGTTNEQQVTAMRQFAALLIHGHAWRVMPATASGRVYARSTLSWAAHCSQAITTAQLWSIMRQGELTGLALKPAATMRMAPPTPKRRGRKPKVAATSVNEDGAAGDRCLAT